jgi:hypothetical protein
LGHIAQQNLGHYSHSSILCQSQYKFCCIYLLHHFHYSVIPNVKNGPYTIVEFPLTHIGHFGPIVLHDLEGITPLTPRILTQKYALGSTWCFTQSLLHKRPLVLWFQLKTVVGVIVTMSFALERVSVGYLQGVLNPPTSFIPHDKTVWFRFHELSMQFTRILTLTPFACH